MTSFRTPILIATIAGCVLAIQACNTSGHATIGTEVFGVKGEVETGWEPEEKGGKIGTYTDAATGTTYDLYDVNGDGQPDMANEQDTNNWFVINRIDLIPVNNQPTVNIQSTDDLNRAEGKSSTPPVFEVTGGTLVLSPSTLGESAYLTDPNGAVHVTLPFDPDMLSSSIDTSSGSDLAATVFNFNGYTEAQILAQYGWVDDGDDEYTIDSYSDLIVDGNTDQDDMHAFFVFASGVDMPNFADYDLTYSIVPGNQWDDEFSCYGIAVSGNVYAISAFASDVGIHELDITDNSSGLTLVTTLDAQTNTATSTILGVPYDSYSY